MKQWLNKYKTLILHKHWKVYVSSVTRVVRCPVLWIICVVNNVMFFCYFFYRYILLGTFILHIISNKLCRVNLSFMTKFVKKKDKNIAWPLLWRNMHIYKNPRWRTFHFFRLKYLWKEARYEKNGKRVLYMVSNTH
jgi:hypothetical protein